MSENRKSQGASALMDLQPGARAPMIEIVSDVVCPWCFMGKRRLEKALAILGRRDVAVRWKPFQLHPDIQKDGVDRQAFRARKFGSLTRSQELEARVAAAGAGEGIEFLDRIHKVPNTFEAHLVWFGGPRGHAGRDRRIPVSRVLHRGGGCRRYRGAEGDRNCERP